MKVREFCHLLKLPEGYRSDCMGLAICKAPVITSLCHLACEPSGSAGRDDTEEDLDQCIKLLCATCSDLQQCAHSKMHFATLCWSLHAVNAQVHLAMPFPTRSLIWRLTFLDCSRCSTDTSIMLPPGRKRQAGVWLHIAVLWHAVYAMPCLSSPIAAELLPFLVAERKALCVCLLDPTDDRAQRHSHPPKCLAVQKVRAIKSGQCS